MKFYSFAAAALALRSSTVTAAPVLAPPQPLSAELQQYVKVPGGRIALVHVRVIDGTGAVPLEDQVVLIEGPRIVAVRPASAPFPTDYHAIDASGDTVLPGLVGMHNHLFYLQRPNIDPNGKFEAPIIVPQMTFSAPRLYLASGVTTMRTTGSVEPYTDLSLKREIDAGHLVGPHLDVTGPYLEGASAFFIQNHQLQSAQDARETVAYWAGQGVNSFKAYMNITRAELKAAIDEAHRHHLKLTGHLCSVTYPEAVELGIDNLEHGFFVNTQLDPGKQPDKCPDTAGDPTIAAMTPGSPEAHALIKLLVDHHVAITSTLPVFEQSVPLHAPLQARQMQVLTPQAKESYLYLRNLTASRAGTKRGEEEAQKYKNDLGLERQFVAV